MRKGPSLTPQAQWILRRRIPPQLPSSFDGLDRLLARILYARKIEQANEIESFLHPDSPLADPFSLAGMREAVSRLLTAVAQGEGIVVYGDYDADGVTASALLVTALRQMGARVEHYIPSRSGSGYGLDNDALDRIKVKGTALLVTVDCGIRAAHQAEHAAEIGLDLIITDHHTVPEDLPRALAVIDPKRPDCDYPFKELAGVGVAYRLVEALYAAWNSRAGAIDKRLDATPLLDLVAVGTVADIVPLGGENRALVRQGLEILRSSPRPGLCALMTVSGTKPDRVDSQDIAFRLGPRINAASRMECSDPETATVPHACDTSPEDPEPEEPSRPGAELAYALLMSTTDADASRLASELNELNRQRQDRLGEQVQIAVEIAEQIACEEIGPAPRRRILFITDQNTDAQFDHGIVGLIASRLTEMYYLPSLVMRVGDQVRGSARSIEGFHITRALESCADLLIRFGGHAMAAGCTLARDNIENLRQRLEQYAAEHLDVDLLHRKIRVDAIVSLDEITLHSVRCLQHLEPTGNGNPPATLSSLGVRIDTIRPVGKDGKHLRLYLSQGGSRVGAIAFRLGHLANEYRAGDLIDLVYTPSLNYYNGNVSVQLIVEEIRPSRESARTRGQ